MEYPFIWLNRTVDLTESVKIFTGDSYYYKITVAIKDKSLVGTGYYYSHYGYSIAGKKGRKRDAITKIHIESNKCKLTVLK